MVVIRDKRFSNSTILIIVGILAIVAGILMYFNNQNVSDGEKNKSETESINTRIEMNIKLVKENFKVGMSKDEVKQVFGEPSIVQSSETLMEGYETTEVWRYDVAKAGSYDSKEYYEFEKDDMLVNLEGLRSGYIAGQLFIEWSKGEENLSNYGSLFYFQDGEIYRYELDSKGAEEEAIVAGVALPYIEYNKGLPKIKGTISLTFHPVSITPLKISKPKDDYKKVESIQLEGIDGSIELYTNPNDLPKGMGSYEEIFGVLSHEGQYYDLGLISSYGMESMEVEMLDVDFDNEDEIKIVGHLGTTYSQMKIINFNEKTKQWENILTMGSPKIVDLDGDGVEEFVAISTGSMPSYVDIYRWKDKEFQRADILKSTESHNTILYKDDEGWIIETHTVATPTDGNKRSTDTKFYKYEKGKLIELNYNPKRLISQPVKLPKFNGTISRISHGHDEYIFKV